MMPTLLQEALRPFMYMERREPPYSYGPIRVQSARLKVTHGMTLRGRQHRLSAAAIAFAPSGRTLTAGRYLCPGLGAVVRLIDEPDANLTCPQCESIAAGPCVYRCFDATDRLLYVGSTGDLYARTAAHRRSTPWWSEVARVETDYQPDRFTAYAVESAAITAESPAHNRRRSAA